MPRQVSPATKRAAEIFAGERPGPDELESLARTLKAELNFGYARRLWERRFHDIDVQASTEKKLEVGSQWVLCTYKDPDLPTGARLDDALKILRGIADLHTTTDQETLGLAGAIYKRRWEAFARKEDLERSLAFYLRGYELGPQSRNPWYPGINAAFVLDLLAGQETPEPTRIAAGPAARLKQAQDIRATIAHGLKRPERPSAKDWWTLATLAEAYFGQGRFREAGLILEDASGLEGVSDWEKESAARQLASLVRLRKKLPAEGQDPIDDAWKPVALLAGGNESAAMSAFNGRFGLALSGGGFRASLFHIGVLARLAELDLLRGIECISCVSGGSIIGAHYYLHVRHLLQTKSDADITAADYVRIVEKVAEEFVAGVQRNIRTRVAAEFTTNLKMIFYPNYSRTLRLGELYERELYARVADGEAKQPRWLNELIIHPLGEPANFSPKTHNWRRHAKAPNLVINATALNTGHNWQFTATWMGEPPGAIDSEIDANYRLRRLYHDQAPPAHRATRLGYAVAASSGVPGLFEPLPLAKLYPSRIVGLVDGGVHDNQGTSALLEQDCTVILVSDASGQMDTMDRSPSGLLSVILRANSILQARIRQAQFVDVAARRRAGLLSGLVFLHLKKDLGAAAIDWIDSQDPCPPPKEDPLTSYGVQKKIQRQLAATRTDLDSFSDTEAYALMTSGYLMTKKALEPPDALGFPILQACQGRWKFREAEPLMKAATPPTRFMRRLKVAELIAFKVWLLSRELQFVAAAISLTIIGLLIADWGNWSTFPLVSFSIDRLSLEMTLGTLITGIVVAAVLALGVPLLWRLRPFSKTFQQIAIGIGMASFGFLVARLHLHVFDRLFLWLGKIK